MAPQAHRIAGKATSTWDFDPTAHSSWKLSVRPGLVRRSVPVPVADDLRNHGLYERSSLHRSARGERGRRGGLVCEDVRRRRQYRRPVH